MTVILAFIFSFAALASDQDTFEKSYPRDNTFCQIGDKRVEIMIRSSQSLTEPKERLWGDTVFSRSAESDKPSKWPIGADSGHYRFFPGTPSACTKTIGSMVDGKFVLFFQKLNSPHKNQLIIQYVDPKTRIPLQTVSTSYLADQAKLIKDGIVFQSHQLSRQEIEMGRVTINGQQYLFQDHEFLVWIKLDKDGFSPEPFVTYENFTHKTFFKTFEDFKTLSGWQDSGKSFTRTKLYVAINNSTKSKCVLLLEGKKSFTGEEAWICQ